MTKGMIHIYTGEGKGKTTASFGLAKRAAGHGNRVLVLQFLKSRVKNSGELNSARELGIKVVKFRNQITPLFDPKVKISDLKTTIKKAVARTVKELKSNLYDLVILDEFNVVLSSGYATMNDVEHILDAKPAHVELVLSGRGAPKELIEIADYVTEMKMIKHPFENGVKARKGIEY